MKHELENKGKRKGCNGKNKGAVKKKGELRLIMKSQRRRIPSHFELCSTSPVNKSK